MKAKSTIAKWGQFILVAALFSGAQAFGQSTITLPSQTFTNINDSITGDDTGGYALTFAKFDTTLGTLTSVTLDISNVSVSGTVSVENGSGVQRTYNNVALVGNYYVSDAASSINPNPTDSVTVMVTTANTNGLVVNPGQTGMTVSETSPTSGLVSSVITNPATLALYEGVGANTINVSVSSQNTGTATGTGTFTVSEASSGTGTADIIYTYSPVPEPASTAAWMIGFALCVYLGRNYFRRSAV